MTLADQLNPGRVKTSGKFTAILAFILDEVWTDPAIGEMAITSDGVLMAGNVGDIGLNDIVGDAADLDNNLHGLAATCALSPVDTAELLARAQTHITDWRR